MRPGGQAGSGSVSRRSIFFIVVVVFLGVMALPALGLLIFFGGDIVTALIGPRTLASGVKISYKLTLDRFAPPPSDEDLKNCVLARIDPRGRFGCKVEFDKANDLLTVSVPGALAEQAKRLLAQQGRLEFRIVADRTRDRMTDFDRQIRQKLDGQADPNDPVWRWFRLKKGGFLYQDGISGKNMLEAMGFVYVVDPKSQEVEVLVQMDDRQDVTERDLARAMPWTQDGTPVVSFEMRPAATSRFARLTKTENVGRHLAIIMDGEIQTAPVLQSTLSANGIITGYKDRNEVDEVVRILNSGKLGVPLGEPVSEELFGRP
jgi:SecD/SecF fusion protein